MQAIILAGGFGTRLRSVVSDVPKPMAPIGAEPFLAVLLKILNRQGINDIVLSVGFMRKSIMDYFGTRHGGSTIRYCIETEPLGTGGAIRKSLEMIESPQGLVLNGDTFLDIDYRALAQSHQTHGVAMSIALKQVADTARYGCTHVEGDTICAFGEKNTPGPGLINAGVYLMNAGIFSGHDLPEKFSFENDFLYPNIKSLRPHGFTTDRYFIDIGIPEDYQRAQQELPTFL